MAVIFWLVDGAQVAIDLLKVHCTHGAEHPGIVFCGGLAGATKLGVACRRGRGEQVGGSGGGRCCAGDRSLAGSRGGEGRVRTG